MLPFIQQGKPTPNLAAVGCSFGGYHAVNLALRHPDVVTAFLSMGGAFDPSHFLNGHYDQDTYFNLPLHYLPNLNDSWYMDRYRHNSYVLATGVHDMCRDQNERLASVMQNKGIPVRIDIWGDNATHDWPWWKKMMQAYL